MYPDSGQSMSNLLQLKWQQESKQKMSNNMMPYKNYVSWSQWSLTFTGELITQRVNMGYQFFLISCPLGS